jgi:DNA modification methylase
MVERMILTGDAKDLFKRLEDESVDMVFTDPPYHEKYMHLYGLLAQECPRVMRPGSWAFIYGGWVSKEILDLLYAGEWDFFAVFALVHKGGHPKWWSKKLMMGYKPVFVFTKGEPPLRWQNNTIISPQRDKGHHAWGQSIAPAVVKIEMFTQPGDTILDPFCGGGTTPAAAKVTGRECIAFEIDPDMAEAARERVKNTNPPLFVRAPEQIGMDL